MSSFALNTWQLMREAINKASQMSGYDMPRVLVIASSHPDSSLLLGSHGATELLTGTTSFSAPISSTSSDPEIKIITRLQNSAFARIATSGDRVEPARQSISAILLMWITAGSADVIGLLHPEPRFPFDHRTFDTVHFVKFRDWPLNDRFAIEWVGPSPDPTRIPHFPIEFEYSNFADSTKVF